MGDAELLIYMIENQQGPVQRRPRKFRRRTTTQEEVNSWEEDDFIERYRVDKTIFWWLHERFVVSPYSNKTRRSQAAEPGVQLMEGLRFYGHASDLIDVADNYGLHRTTTSSTIRKCTRFLNTMRQQVIYFPKTQQDMRQSVLDFYEMANFPRVVGCIDGTHILIKGPAEDEDYYVDRNNHHSLTVQAICNSKLEILSIDPAWPGSTHDAYVLMKSDVRRGFRQGMFGNYVLLGDSGYGLTPWLLTPYNNPITDEEKRYNRAHKTTRCCVERCFGVLKSRFRCISKSGGILERDPEEATRIVVACAVLHNLCIRGGLPDPDLLPNEEYRHGNNRPGEDRLGIQARQQFTTNAFH